MHIPKQIICVIYVDDCLFFAKKVETIHKFMREIESTMPMKIENSVLFSGKIQSIFKSRFSKTEHRKNPNNLLNKIESSESN